MKSSIQVFQYSSNLSWKAFCYYKKSDLIVKSDYFSAAVPTADTNLSDLISVTDCRLDDTERRPVGVFTDQTTGQSSLWFERTSSTSRRKSQWAVLGLCVCVRFYFGIKDWLPPWQGMGVWWQKALCVLFVLLLERLLLAGVTALFTWMSWSMFRVSHFTHCTVFVAVWGWCMQHVCMFYVLNRHVRVTCVDSAPRWLLTRICQGGQRERGGCLHVVCEDWFVGWVCFEEMLFSSQKNRYHVKVLDFIF